MALMPLSGGLCNPNEPQNGRRSAEMGDLESFSIMRMTSFSRDKTPTVKGGHDPLYPKSYCSSSSNVPMSDSFGSSGPGEEPSGHELSQGTNSKGARGLPPPLPSEAGAGARQRCGFPVLTTTFYVTYQLIC